jgi:hypothetical protein
LTSVVRYGCPACGGTSNAVPWKYWRVNDGSVIACHTCSGVARR